MTDLKHTNDTQLFSDFDQHCMKRALTLSRRGLGKTSPNPMVGALIAREGRILGEGWHRRYGGKHAESEAIGAVAAAGETATGATLYCTLEPCCFTAPDKHQPPCAELVIKSGVRRVVIASLDPHRRVNGAGAAMLRKAGIAVETGLFAAAEAEVNRAYRTFQRAGRPFVHLKIAQTLDGRIAAPKAALHEDIVSADQWITDEAARKIVHRMRAEYDAVLVGKGTVLADDPELTVRLVRGRNPLRVILGLGLPEEAKVLTLPDRKNTLVICAAAAADGAAKLRGMGVDVICLDADATERGLPLQPVLEALGAKGVRSVLVEGGSRIFSSFLREGLWDRITVFIAPIILGNGVGAVSGLGINTIRDALRLTDVSFRRVGDQLLFEGNHVYRNC
ncbi:riboflavin biosynthesis protein RibD [Spirochaetia bacterium]|nr:riboflavin biosynthesis protein RibD [Spirochaetia bacterium]